MKRFSLTIFTIITLYVPVLIHAEEYKPLVGIPGVDPSADFSGYINSLYALSISIAALLAVIKIVIAGVKWMLSDVVTNKMEAKSDIKGALIGLLVVLAAVLILTVINPDLVNVNLTLNKPNEAVLVKPASTVVAPPVFNTAAFTYIEASKLTPEQIKIFRDNCSAGNHTYSVSGAYARCFKNTIGVSTALYAKSCVSTVPDVCTASRADAQTNCLAKKNATFNIDALTKPPNEYYTCIYEN